MKHINLNYCVSLVIACSKEIVCNSLLCKTLKEKHNQSKNKKSYHNNPIKIKASIGGNRDRR